ncbi:hypothetical protein M5E06_00690 [Azospirillum sp. A1-3]|uniref:hypothetical protein n=1 Tax=Azospirillum sp. A1-3 TaxID=185874 RepID=UPI0020770836|nr:hypothetical protein [Azospirillum sp. A1-3]MCM8732717.1 hypothetical protein [Azospirillum sp. A1-3]
MSTVRPTILPKMLTALLLAAGAAALSGCVAYDGYDPYYYPTYSEPVVVPPPTVYAVPPPVIVQPGYRYRSWDDDHGRRDRGRGGRDWGDRGWHQRERDHNGDPHAWERPGGPHGWSR